MTEKIYNKLTVVDKDNQVIGAEYLFDLLEKGLLYRSSRVCVFNESGQILLQTRSEHVLHPLLLDYSASGRVDEGDSYLETAQKELHEELGLYDLNLIEVSSALLVNGCFSSLYKTVVPDDTVIRFDPEEVHSVAWYNVDKLEKDMQNKAESFSADFLQEWLKIRDKILT